MVSDLAMILFLVQALLTILLGFILKFDILVGVGLGQLSMLYVMFLDRIVELG